MTNNKLPIALFNGTVATTNGLYRITDIDIETAKCYLDEVGFISAIGHEATAVLMSEILCRKIEMCRIQFYQEITQLAIVFKLKIRPVEGAILTRDEIESIGYDLKLMERLE